MDSAYWTLTAYGRLPPDATDACRPIAELRDRRLDRRDEAQQRSFDEELGAC